MRTRTSARVAGVLLVAASLAACRSLVPAGFWKGYRSNLIIKQESDQGPWGGHRWICWDSPNSGTFSESDAKQFALDHGWKFLVRVEVPANALTRPTDTQPQAVSSLFHPGYDQARQDFPAYITGESVVLTFDSGWRREDPGTNETSTAVGYLQLSRDGRKMLVYHLWGNS